MSPLGAVIIVNLSYISNLVFEKEKEKKKNGQIWSSKTELKLKDGSK